MVLAESLVITHLVPFVTLGGSKERLGQQVSMSKCEGNPDTSKEFKNSMGKCTAWNSSSTESSDQYSTGLPGNSANKAMLIVRVVSLSGAKMHHSESQAIFLKLESKSGYTFANNSSTPHTKVPRQLNYIRASVYRILTVSNG